MAGGDKQDKNARLKGPNTPKKPKMPSRPVVGSSSTWKQDELDLFKVQVAAKVTEANSLIPKKWFDFGGLQRYQDGMIVSEIN